MTNFILITGNDQLAIKNKAEKIVEEIKEKSDNAFSFETVKGDTESAKAPKILEELLTAINTPSFFSESKTIWLKHFSFFNLATGKEKKNKEVQEINKVIIKALENEIKEKNDFTLIIDGPDLDKRTAFYKFFTKNGDVVNLSKISTTDKNYQINLRNKIRELCEIENVKIAYNAVEFLADTVGAETGRLTGEIAKLIAYVGNKKTISLNDCQEICSKSYEMANWVFADALASKNMKDSFSALNIIIDKMTSEKTSGSNPELSMLFNTIRKFRDIVKVKSGAELLSIDGHCQYPFFKSAIETAKDRENSSTNVLLSLHPYRAFKLYEQASNFKNKELAGIFTSLLDANRELVSGATSSRIVLENLIIKICS